MKKCKLCTILTVFLFLLCGCVDQRNPTESDDIQTQTASEPSLAATSVAVMQICEKLDLDLTGVPASSLVEIPDRYANATSLGSPMSPDMEILSQLSPDWVLSPSSLKNDLQPKYEAAGLRYCFLNLKSVTGMYKCIEEMGELFSRNEEASALIAEFQSFYAAYQASHADRQSPTVLILMGLPGSYVVATENSYVGNLVELAGGINVYAGTEEEFLNVNTEDMLQKDPDIILRTAHAMPDSVMEMFASEFETNDIWKHFRAVENKRVYDLPYESCGMSANFHWQDALSLLDTLLYPKEELSK